MANRSIQLVAALTLATLIAGCQTVNTYEPHDQNAVKHVIKDRRVESDLSLKDKAQMQELIYAHTPDGFLKVQAEFYNGTNARAEVNYRFEWIDEQGMQIQTPLSSWKRVSLAGRESVMIQGMAPTKNAVDFKLKIVEPKS
jgi:uncharacterized protein YcfL